MNTSIRIVSHVCGGTGGCGVDRGVNVGGFVSVGGSHLIHQFFTTVPLFSSFGESVIGVFPMFLHFCGVLFKVTGNITKIFES